MGNGQPDLLSALVLDNDPWSLPRQPVPNSAAFFEGNTIANCLAGPDLSLELVSLGFNLSSLRLLDLLFGLQPSLMVRSRIPATNVVTVFHSTLLIIFDCQLLIYDYRIEVFCHP